MKRNQMLLCAIVCVIICVVVVAFGVDFNGCADRKIGSKTRTYEIAGAGSDGVSTVWEDGKASR